MAISSNCQSLNRGRGRSCKWSSYKQTNTVEIHPETCFGLSCGGLAILYGGLNFKLPWLRQILYCPTALRSTPHSAACSQFWCSRSELSLLNYFHYYAPSCRRHSWPLNLTSGTEASYRNVSRLWHSRWVGRYNVIRENNTLLTADWSGG